MDLVARVKAILLSPRTEWPVIEAEPTSIGNLYMGYILPLAAIGPIAMFIGRSVLGYSMLGVTTKMSMGSGLTWMVEQYVLSLISVFLFGLIINMLAPTFNAEKDQLQAFKLATYASTASWLAGIFAILPATAVLSLLGLYSLYLLYVGLPIMMKCPPEKAMGYTVTAIIVAVVLVLIMGAVQRMVTPGAMGMM